jgi:hypothetical protein
MIFSAISNRSCLVRKRIYEIGEVSLVPNKLATTLQRLPNRNSTIVARLSVWGI